LFSLLQKIIKGGRQTHLTLNYIEAERQSCEQPHTNFHFLIRRKN